MSSASGSPDENKALPGAPFLTRRGWRITGVVSLTASAVMAWNGVALAGAEWSWLALTAYWGAVVVLIVVAVYTVLIDLRFTHLHYVLAEREIFMDTLGSEEFRKEIRRIMEVTPPAEASRSTKDGSAKTQQEGPGNP